MTAPLTQGDVAVMVANARGLASLGMAGGYDEVLYELADAVDGLFEQLEAERQFADKFQDEVRELQEQFDALRRAAGDFVTAYRAASVSDEEGLLMATDPDAMRQLWHRVDEAATDVEQAL